MNFAFSYSLRFVELVVSGYGKRTIHLVSIRLHCMIGQFLLSSRTMISILARGRLEFPPMFNLSLGISLIDSVEKDEEDQSAIYVARFEGPT